MDTLSTRQEETVSVLRQVIEQGFNQGNYDALDHLMAETWIEHQPGLYGDLAGFKRDIQYLRTAFPDFHLTIEATIVDGDHVWARSTARGTNTGPFMGPPTGKPIEVTVYDECRVQDGRLVEHWGVPDRFSVLAQIGRLPKG